MTKIIPVLRVFDYEKTIEFYVGWLGGQVVWEHKPDGLPFYMQISISGMAINLSQHHGDCSPGALIMITDFKDLRAYHQILTEKKYVFMRPGVEKVEWDPNSITMTVTDPFHNRIEFCESFEAKNVN